MRAEHIINEELKSIGRSKWVFYFLALLLYLTFLVAELDFFFFLLATGVLGIPDILLARKQKKLLKENFDHPEFNFSIRGDFLNNDEGTHFYIILPVFFIVTIFLTLNFSLNTISIFLFINIIPALYYFFRFRKKITKINFSKDFILLEGLFNEVVLWEEVLDIKELPEKNCYEISLAHGDNLFIGNEPYYLQGNNVKEIVDFIKERISDAGNASILTDHAE